MKHAIALLTALIVAISVPALAASLELANDPATGGPGRNHFIGDITGFQFEAFTVGGETIRTPEAGLFDFGPGAGVGFTFQLTD